MNGARQTHRTGSLQITSGTAVLITAAELAQLMQISERTLWRLLSAGKVIQPVRIGGNTRWRLSEIEQWVAAGCPSPAEFSE